jgi:LPS export ABC transporter permease LptF
MPRFLAHFQSRTYRGKVLGLMSDTPANTGLSFGPLDREKAFHKYPRIQLGILKYLINEILFSFFTGTATFLLIMLLMQAIRLMEFIIVHQVGMADVGRIVAALGLSFLPLAMPIAYLFAVLLGISRANSEGEIIALQVSGIRIRDIFLPVLGFGFVMAGICLYLSLYSVPIGNRRFELLITKLGQEKVMSSLKPGVFVEGFYGLTILAEQTIPVKNELKKIFIFDKREENHPLAITAQAGLLRLNEERGVLTLRLSDGSIHMQNETDETIQQKINFDVYDINLDVGKTGEAWRPYSPPSYNYDELKQKIAEAAHDPPQHRQLLVEFHRRFSMSFACVVFAALGFFIGILSQKGVTSAAIVLCLLVATAYWLTYVAANALAVQGKVAPWLGIWAPNFAFLFFSWLAYKRSRAR